MHVVRPSPHSPTFGREHARSDGVGEDTGQVVGESANRNGFIPQSTGRRFRHNGVTSWADRGHVDEGLDDEEDTDAERCVLGVEDSENTSGDKADEHDEETRHVNCRTTDTSHD